MAVLVAAAPHNGVIMHVPLPKFWETAQSGELILLDRDSCQNLGTLLSSHELLA
jgi:hypothetical protein